MTPLPLRPSVRLLPADAREAEIARISAIEVAAEFDLAHGPLIRGQLLRLSADEHILLITQHHIISDGWSIGVLIRETSSDLKKSVESQTRLIE